jgi:predicted dehydrogenase
VTAPVRVAVIGVGAMGSRWAQALGEHPGARVSVVSDVREDAGRTVANDLSARFFADPLEAATHPDVDAVAVCTPEHVHVEPAVAAIDAGKAVMVEKPLADTVEGSEAIRDRAAACGVPLLVGHILRFEPRYAAAHDAIAAGTIGAVQALRHERIGLVTDQDVLRGRTTIALYYGVHEFDLARWYAGEVERIDAERSEGVLRAHGYEIEDLYSALLRFRSGAHGTAMLGWSLPARTPGYGVGGVTVIGERGVIRVSQGDVGLLVVDQDGLRDVDAYYAPAVHGRLRGALAIEVDHFVDCARGAADPACTATDGVEAVRISLAMETSAEQRMPIDVESAVSDSMADSAPPSSAV